MEQHVEAHSRNGEDCTLLALQFRSRFHTMKLTNIAALWCEGRECEHGIVDMLKLTNIAALLCEGRECERGIVDNHNAIKNRVIWSWSDGSTATYKDRRLW